jgi:hypothetical protein
MKSWMTCFALGAKCATLEANGDALTLESSAKTPRLADWEIKLAKPNEPNPAPIRLKASRRLAAGLGSRWNMNYLTYMNSLALSNT